MEFKKWIFTHHKKTKYDDVHDDVEWQTKNFQRWTERWQYLPMGQEEVRRPHDTAVLVIRSEECYKM